MTYYRDDLALVHHLGFGFHAEMCAPGILTLLEPVKATGGTVLELGCGSGLLTRELVDAGHRVLATDASLPMLALAREHAPGAEAIFPLVLPRDPLPEADAVVSVGHVLCYLENEADINETLAAAADALRPGGILALDLCDTEWGRARRDAAPYIRKAEQWMIVTEFSLPSEARFTREITTFLRNQDGSWRRDDERHENVLLDTSIVPDLLARHGVEATVQASFGDEELPPGLVAVVGRKHS